MSKELERYIIKPTTGTPIVDNPKDIFKIKKMEYHEERNKYSITYHNDDIEFVNERLYIVIKQALQPSEISDVEVREAIECLPSYMVPDKHGEKYFNTIKTKFSQLESKVEENDSLKLFLQKTEECKVDIVIEGTDTYIGFGPETENYKVSMVYAIAKDHLEVHVQKSSKCLTHSKN